MHKEIAQKPHGKPRRPAERNNVFGWRAGGAGDIDKDVAFSDPPARAAGLRALMDDSHLDAVLAVEKQNEH